MIKIEINTRIVHSFILAAFFMLAGMAPTVGAATTSPFPPPVEKLGTYVIDDAPGLDTGCTYGSGGPLVIRLKVPATVNHNEISSSGYFLDPKKLINNRVISEKTVIRMPVYDIDCDYVGSVSPEKDLVYFNGFPIKYLSGINGKWTDDSLVVDTSKIKFVSSNSPDVYNEIKIDIDVANGGNNYWCMAVDWVSFEFDSVYPYVLVHGINADRDTWQEGKSFGILGTLDELGVLYERFSLGKNGSSYDNGKLLARKIKEFLAPLKSTKVNIIAHSKGGLDTQSMATDRSRGFDILSLSSRP